jgi:hypothetical protein
MLQERQAVEADLDDSADVSNTKVPLMISLHANARCFRAAQLSPLPIWTKPLLLAPRFPAAPAQAHHPRCFRTLRRNWMGKVPNTSILPEPRFSAPVQARSTLTMMFQGSPLIAQVESDGDALTIAPRSKVSSIHPPTMIHSGPSCGRD